MKIEYEKHTNPPSRFLHDHPITEKVLGVDKDHKIVDVKDWEKARRMYFERISSLLTDDLDTSDATLEMYVGSNDDYYLELKEKRFGEVRKIVIRIAMSGGNASTAVKLAVANLYRALNGEHSNISVIKLDENNEPKDQRLFRSDNNDIIECKVCGKPFDSIQELYEHYDEYHNHEKE